MDPKKVVLEMWDNGHNCARSTGAGILKAYEDPHHTVLFSAMTSYGGGMGEGSICGAVSGTIAAVSKLLHDKGVPDEKIREKVNLMKLKLKFTMNNSDLECHHLLDNFMVEGEVDYDHPGRKGQCTKVVETAVELAQQILDEV